MKIIDSEKLEKFIRKHADADKAIQKWIQICEAADWKSHSDLKNDFLLRESDIIHYICGMLAL